MNQTSSEVLVVGAGPVGLTLALVLQRSGVRVRIVDSDSGPTEQSRALWVHPRTLEHWAALGLAERAISRGLKAPFVHLLINGKQRGSLPLYSSTNSPFSSGIVLEQSASVRLLLEGFEAGGGVVEWHTQLEAFESGAGGPISATLRRGEEVERCQTQFLVGTDGARSTVRRGLQLPFEGDSYATKFFVADVEMAWTRGRSGVFLGLSQKGFFGIFPMPASERHFRLLGTIDANGLERPAGSESTSPQTAVGQQQLERILFERSGQQLGIERVSWATLYQTHKRLVSSYRVGNVFLAGDAAHVHSPAGGQGMNLGIGDAMNLGWKLAHAVQKGASETLLDSYQSERRPVAATVIARADRMFDLEVASGRVAQWFRALLMPVVALMLRAIAPAREAFFRFLSQTWIGYRDSPVIDGRYSSGRVRPGDRLPHLTWTDEHGQSKRLHDVVNGTDHIVLVTNDGHGWQQARAALTAFKLAPRWVSIPSQARVALKQLGAERPTLFLVRPDGHLAARASLEGQTEFVTFVERVYGGALPADH
jgi:2-polyprenyl-6-methoxyphenol hydroxylase-like FAD-dependent oxidoreductase